jgi:ATP-dependent Zn proteases
MTPEEEKFLKTKSDLMSHITSYMGGRVSEEVNLGEISTGAHNDIQEATKIARAMVLEYGMSKLGPIQYQNVTGNVFLGRDYINQQNYSSEVAYEIDKEVRDIIDTAYNKAKEIIKKHAKELFIIVDALIERETLTAEEISELLGVPVVAEES